MQIFRVDKQSDKGMKKELRLYKQSGIGHAAKR